jgi:hypothetical protein
MKISVPATMLKHTNQQTDVVVDAATVDEALRALAATYPPLDAMLYDKPGVLNVRHRFFLNGEMLRSSCLSTRLAEDDHLEIIGIAAGG